MDLSKEQLLVLKGMMIPEATNDDLIYIKEICRSRKLDPFAGDIVFRKQAGKVVAITTIDGARRKAARTGEYAGCDPTIMEPVENDIRCTLTVYRLVGGQRCPFPASRWMSETKGNGPTWRSMPKLMLEKCTEMYALRKAFPEECGGAYDEAEPFDAHEQEKTAVIPDTPSNQMRWDKVKAAFAVYGIAESDILKEVGDRKLEEFTDEDFTKLHDWYQKCASSHS